MSHAENKVRWCLRKADKELREQGKHRGLVRIKPDLKKAREHVKKAEHYLKATSYLKEGNFSDISVGTVFYSIYHCLLAIAAKFGYESRNQECTFALIYTLIEDNTIDIEKKLLDKIATFDTEGSQEQTTVEIREHYQYGTSLSIKDNIYEELLSLAKEILSRTKEIIEE